MKINWESQKYMVPVYLIFIAIIVYGFNSVNWAYFLGGVTATYVILHIVKENWR